MKNIILILIVITISTIVCSCSKYQVVSEVNVNLYHLHNPKTNDIQVILTSEKLKVGGWYHPKQIKTIDVENENKKNR